MNALLELSVPDWVILVPLALALGLVLYLSLLGLAIFPYAAVSPTLPGDLELLSTPLVIVPSALLYLLGWLVRRRRIPELFWEGGNVGVRCLAAGLLALLVIPDASPMLRITAAFSTGTAAGALQLTRLGWITLDRHGGIVPVRPSIQKLGVDTVALGLLWLTLLAPGVGFVLAAVVFAALVIGAGPAIRAGRVSVVALVGLFRQAAGRAGWTRAARLPKRLLRSVTEGWSAEGATVRAVPAAILRGGRVRSFLDGWLVAGAGPPRFLPRTGRRGSTLPLGPSRRGARVHGDLFTEVELADADGDVLLMVPAGGPGPGELEKLLGEGKNL